MKINVAMIKCFQAVEFGRSNNYSFVVGTPTGPTDITYDTDTQFFCMSRDGVKSKYIPRENVPYCEFIEESVIEKPKRGRPSGNREGAEATA